MRGLRRRSAILGIATAWLFALGALLGGLSLARLLPEAHASALAHQTLCLTEGGVPADYQAGHAGFCPVCPASGATAAFAVEAAPEGAPVLRQTGLAADFGGEASSSTIVTWVGHAEARGPPRG